MRVVHNIDPLYDQQSKILILGSFPSVASRGNFYYHHPKNRFWKIMSLLLKEKLEDTEEKKQALLKNNIALWDVIKQCDIQGSSDSSIKNVIPNDLEEILQIAPIKTIFANGSKASELYFKYCYPLLKQDIITLPSSSPANAKYSLESLLEKWRVILDSK